MSNKLRNKWIRSYNIWGKFRSKDFLNFKYKEEEVLDCRIKFNLDKIVIIIIIKVTTMLILILIIITFNPIVLGNLGTLFFIKTLKCLSININIM